MSRRASSRVQTKVAKDEEKAKTLAAPFDLVWEDVDNYFYALDTESKMEGSAKIAGFDMDHTLVVPKSGAKFPAGRSDWKWWDSSVPEKLKSLHKDGFKIVIWTNQGGIEKHKQNKGDITGKITDLAKELGFPLQAFIAGAEDHYRKPFTTMWDYMVEHHNGGIKPDMNESFYCGDAAGRPAGWKAGYKKDFSATDRKFAFNCGLKFLTPEELFLEEEAVDFEWRSINPATLIANSGKKLADSYHSDSQEMVIMVGRPASGKSTFVEKYFVPHNYTRVNRDTLKTPAKCKAVAKEALNEGLSVVIDNTNGSAATRAEYIALAQAKEVPVRCFYMKTEQEVANHLNYLRVKETVGAVRRIPDVAYRTFNKGFQEPEKSEGFEEIVEIDFVPDLRGDKEFEKLFKGYTPEGL